MIKILKSTSAGLAMLILLANQAYAQTQITTQQQTQTNSNVVDKFSNLSLRIAVPFFTILDKELYSVEGLKNISTEVKNRLKSVNRYEVKEITERLDETKLLTSDQIVPIGKNNGLDVVLTGSIVKMGEDVLVNIRLSETVIGKILFDKQYFVQKNKVKGITEDIITDMESFISNLSEYDIDIYDIRNGTSEVRVKSIPSGAKVSLNGAEIGKTPLMLKNISETQHSIESWLEKDGDIKNMNITSNDNQLFQFKFDDKLYTESIVELSDLVYANEYNFEIIAKPDDKGEDEKGVARERPKAGDIQYDLRKFKIDIFTDPSNLQVVLDGKDVGASPITISDVTPGKHVISLAKKKLIVFKKVVDSYQNKVSEVDFNMFRLGRVLISSIPSKAEIFVDNEKLGETPKSVDLPYDRHVVDIRREGYKSETYIIDVKENQTNELVANLSTLRNVDTNVAYVPTASVDNSLGLSAMALSLGQYTSADSSQKGLTYLYGGEVNYGFKNIFALGEYFKFGAQVGAFYNKLSTFTLSKEFPSNQGVGAKVQFLSQGENMPVSAAIGGFYNFNNSLEKQLSGYIAISRDFGFLSFNLGVQAQPFKLSAVNLSVNYNRFYRIKLGAVVLIDFGLLADKPGEHITPLFGLTAGYNFF